MEYPALVDHFDAFVTERNAYGSSFWYAVSEGEAGRCTSSKFD